MTDRDRRFAEEYLVDLNAKAAAIRAGYSPATAKNAYEWIKESNPKKPQVYALIARMQAERSRRLGITVDKIEEELAAIARANIADVVDFSTGRVLPDAQRADTAAIASIRVRRGESGDEYEVRLSDRIKALELLGKRRGMFDENVKLAVDVPQIVDISDGDE